MKRILIEKKDSFNVEARNLYREFKEYLGIKALEGVRVVNSYEIYGGNAEKIEKITNMVLHEPIVDNVYENMPPMDEYEKAFRVESIRGQYNQREDIVNKLVKNYLGYEDIEVKHSKYIILKNVSNEELNKAKSYYINPTESKEIPLDSFTFQKEEDTDDEVEIVEGFIEMDENELEKLLKEQGLALGMEDLVYVQRYFKEEERRNPTVTELKIIDTYWSDHCRHKTFNTEITNIEIDEGSLKKVFEEAIVEYIASRKYVYGDKLKPISLMDLATINMKEIRKKGLLEDKEETDEVNAASIEIEVDHNGKSEKWLLMFKNETHNHPTEIEPFGGAATCLGGGIRDPLSGRAYVYQAMRITGSADPRQKYEDTLPGKLPQRNITQKAMEGYSSYGNQIGSTSGYIQEFYHEGFAAKRMELGALVAAAPKDWVVRGKPEKGDLVLLIGGRTGRDGIGAAVGSSKEQTKEALIKSGAEVQKGDPILERKIVRLFRNEKATRLIKKCNDFGAGGVSVAVGELADSLYIDLDKVPLKYPGLKDWEIALSESQERMAVLIDRKDLDEFMALVEEEDLEGSVIAEVTDTNRMVMTWRGKKVADISRAFLSTNGIRKKTRVKLLSPKDDLYLKKAPSYIKGEDIRKDFIENMSNLNTASQKGLIERFDNTYGSGTVLNQLGGKYKLTPQEGMVAKIPVYDGKTTTCSIMTCGYDPYLSSWSTFHGGYYAVIESISKAVALGGDFRKIRLTFQEYFEKLGDDPVKWAKPFMALLGAFLVQKNLDIPSIGGKDSMSGSFGDIDVPPSLLSFAVTTENIKNIVSREFKKANSEVVLVELGIDEKGLVDFEELKRNYLKVKELIDKGVVLSSSVVKFGGIARSISEMAFGNRIGFEFNDEVLGRMYNPLYGSIILEIEEGNGTKDLFEGINYSIVGRTISEEEIRLGGEAISLNELIESWQKPLSDVFPADEEKNHAEYVFYEKGTKIRRAVSIAKPKVLIPVFTGTHGEYDLEMKFKEAGADVEAFVFKSRSRDMVMESINELSRKIKDCQILAFANGYILGNEPESGGKLLNLLFRESPLMDAINEHLTVKDGLVLGVGQGLNALIKLGLIENGYVSELADTSAYIAHNSSGRFISTVVDVKVVSNLSPWMSGMNVGYVYSVPLATGEGRIILRNDAFKDNGQIATQYVEENPTGSDLGIESITSPDGRVLGTVSCIDRVGMDIYKNLNIKGIHNIFESGVKYFK